jgi:hypothetical protein
MTDRETLELHKQLHDIIIRELRDNRIEIKHLREEIDDIRREITEYRVKISTLSAFIGGGAGLVGAILGNISTLARFFNVHN